MKLVLVAVGAAFVTASAAACPSYSRPNQAQADQLCNAMSVVYDYPVNGWHASRWVCRPFHPTVTCDQQFQVWVRMTRKRHRPVVWYVVTLEDGTVMDSVRVRRIGDTGGLKA